MIRNPAGILAVLIAIEAAVLFFSGHAKTKRFFRFPPSMFWIYFLPMVVSSANVIPHQSALYPVIGMYVLPASLILLLVAADLKAILKLGRPAIGMMLVGTLGVILGAPAVLFIFKPWLPADAWSGFAALSASWTGGSANMIAVKEALGTPDAVFLPMVVVDTLVAYSWMGILILLAGVQVAYDRWNRSDRIIIEELHQKIAPEPVPASKVLRLEFVALILLTGIAGAFAFRGRRTGTERGDAYPSEYGTDSNRFDARDRVIVHAGQKTGSARSIEDRIYSPLFRVDVDRRAGEP